MSLFCFFQFIPPRPSHLPVCLVHLLSFMTVPSQFSRMPRLSECFVCSNCRFPASVPSVITVYSFPIMGYTLTVKFVSLPQPSPVYICSVSHFTLPSCQLSLLSHPILSAFPICLFNACLFSVCFICPIPRSAPPVSSAVCQSVPSVPFLSTSPVFLLHLSVHHVSPVYLSIQSIPFLSLSAVYRTSRNCPTSCWSYTVCSTSAL